MKKVGLMFAYLFAVLFMFSACAADAGDSGSAAKSPESDSNSQVSYYTLTLNANGGKGSISYNNIQPNQRFVLEKAATLGVTRSGYTFLGWARNSYAENATYADGETIVVKSNITLYAVWKKNSETKTDKDSSQQKTYTVTFETNGGVWKAGYSVPSSYTAETGLVLPDAGKLTKTGYEFTGWHEKSDLSDTAILQVAKGTTGNKKYYASWEKEVVYCTVTFETNGGSDVSSRTVVYGESVTEPDVPTKDGCTFVGWYADSNLTTSYDFAGTVSSDIKLYAKWLNTAGISVTILPNSTVSISKTETDDTIILTATSGHTSYTWKIDDSEIRYYFTGMSANGNTLTISKSRLVATYKYQISLYAPKDGIPYSAQITITKGE